MGRALANAGRCATCGESHRPIWLDGDPIERALCATCVVRAHLGMLVTFHAGVRADAGRIPVLREGAHGERDAMPRIVEKQEFELLEPGVYLAELIDYTDTKKDGTPLMSSGYKGGEPKAQWRFTFELLDYPHEDGRQISAWINKPKDLDSVAQNSNLTLMASALLGVGIGDEWEIVDLLHKRCRVQVETFTKQDGSEGHKIGKFYKPVEVKAPRTEARQPVAPAREPVPTVAQRRAAAAVADPRVDPDEVPF